MNLGKLVRGNYNIFGSRDTYGKKAWCCEGSTFNRLFRLYETLHGPLIATVATRVPCYLHYFLIQPREAFLGRLQPIPPIIPLLSLNHMKSIDDPPFLT